MIYPNSYGTRKEKSRYQVIVLKDDVDQKVWIDEVEEINFSEIRKHLTHGKSIFITSKKKNKLMTCLTNEKAGDEKIDRNSKRRKKGFSETGLIPSLTSVI